MALTPSSQQPIPSGQPIELDSLRGTETFNNNRSQGLDHQAELSLTHPTSSQGNIEVTDPPKGGVFSQRLSELRSKIGLKCLAFVESVTKTSFYRAIASLFQKKESKESEIPETKNRGLEQPLSYPSESLLTSQSANRNLISKPMPHEIQQFKTIDSDSAPQNSKLKHNYKEADALILSVALKLRTLPLIEKEQSRDDAKSALLSDVHQLAEVFQVINSQIKELPQAKRSEEGKFRNQCKGHLEVLKGYAEEQGIDVKILGKTLAGAFDRAIDYISDTPSLKALPRPHLAESTPATAQSSQEKLSLEAMCQVDFQIPREGSFELIDWVIEMNDKFREIAQYLSKLQTQPDVRHEAVIRTLRTEAKDLTELLSKIARETKDPTFRAGCIDYLKALEAHAQAYTGQERLFDSAIAAIQPTNR